MDKRKKFYMKRGICHCCKKLKYLSRNRICMKCSENKIISANYQMKAKEGPVFDKWKLKMQEAFA